MATAGSIVVDLLMRTGAFETDTARAEKLMKQRMKGIEESVNAAASAIAIGGVAIAGGMALWIKQATDTADQLDQLSERTGVAVETLNGLAYATRMSGGDVAELEKGIQSLNKKLSEAAAGDKSTKELFKALGISATDAEGALLQLADVFPQMNKQDQVRVGTDLLGKSYQSLVPLLAQGRDGLVGLIKEGQTLNPITAETAKQAALLNDNMDRLKTLSDGVATTLGNATIPAINRLIEEFNDANRAGLSFGQMLNTIWRTEELNAEEQISKIQSRLDELSSEKSIIAGLFSRPEERVALERELSYWQTRLQRTFNANFNGPDAGWKNKPASVKLPSLAGDSKKAKETADPLADEARAYASAIDAINKAQLSAQTSGMDLSATQQRLVDLFASPEFMRMPDAWKQVIANQAEAAISTEQQAAQTKSYLDLVKELSTEEEKRAEKLRESLRIIDAMKTLNDEQRQSVIGKAVSAATSEAPEYAGLSPEVGGAFGEFKKIDDAQKKLEEWYSKQLELLETFRSERADLMEQFDAEELRLAEQHKNQLAAIEQARSYTQLTAAENVFGSLADMTRQFAGEQSEIYRVMFAFEKAAAIARSVVAIQQGIAMAAANPWPMNLAAMASVAAATASIVSNIASVAMPSNVGARANGGPVSADMPYLIGERGPELFVPNTAGKVLPNSALGGGSGNTTINLIEDKRRAGQTQQRPGSNGQSEIDVFVADILGDGPRAKAVQKAFGLSRRGY